MPESSNNNIRIEKFLSEQGIMSRREAQALMKKGDILLNGKKIRETGIKIDPKRDKITIANQGEVKLKSKETIAVHKPRGVISSKDEDGIQTIFDIFPQFNHLNCVGRLDKESEGLILLSNDGVVTKMVTGKEHDIEKEYIVETRENIMPAMMERMSKGIKLNDGWTKPARAEKIDRNTFRIVLTEGKKHQIRRMADACRLTIKSLKRIRVGNIELGGMYAGQWKKVTRKDI